MEEWRLKVGSLWPCKSCFPRPVWYSKMISTILGPGVVPWLDLCYMMKEASLVAQTVKCLSATQETQVQSPGWEDLLEKKMATPLQYPCLENPMEPDGLQSSGSQRVRHEWATSLHFICQRCWMLLPWWCNIRWQVRRDFANVIKVPNQWTLSYLEGDYPE